MHGNVAARPLLWDKVYTGIPRPPVTAVTVPDNRFALEGHELVIVEVGATDSADTSVLHVPDLELVVAGDVIYNGVHMYLAQARSSAASGRGARDRQGRGAPAAAHRLRAPERASSTTTPTRRSPRPASTSTTPTSSWGPRTRAVDFFIAKLERYPKHLGRTVLWAGAQRVYGVREHPDEDPRRIAVASWL